jgi:hypothetical protein
MKAVASFRIEDLNKARGFQVVDHFDPTPAVGYKALQTVFA